MEETNKSLEADLLDAKKHVEFLQEDLGHKGEQLSRANIEIASQKDDISSKTEEVCHFRSRRSSNEGVK